MASIDVYKDLWLQMDGIAKNCYFANGPSVGCPWHCKSNKGIIIKFKWLGFQIITIKVKKIGWSGITSFYFPALMKMAIFGLFIFKVLLGSNYLMQSIFQTFCSEILTDFKV